ncbi:hypothetical protein XELAEV_18039370mg [Xenopus laevis]|uniref:Uncharacterized protein n=1 Tax=Xenopus laevis TaxID=8355 RepID=A0A974H7W1_XENLA|nr:hypothetical protein XELAEV_18039370mg [Xenopus laevis]
MKAMSDGRMQESAKHKHQCTKGDKTEDQQHVPKTQPLTLKKEYETSKNSKTESLFQNTKYHQNLNCNIQSPSILTKQPSDSLENDAKCTCKKEARKGSYSEEPTNQEPAEEDNTLKQRGSFSFQEHRFPKKFQADATCTMRSQCKHQPGKLPSNVIAWLFRPQDHNPETSLFIGDRNKAMAASL